MALRWFKLTSVFVLCVLFRLLPFRAPNLEPILATQMPIAKSFGALFGFLFGVLSILVYDLITGTLGPWTLLTASAYGVLGLGAAWYLKNRSKTRYFVYFALIGTLFYDAVTGLTVGPLFFGQSFTAALMGQIPFTALHLLGNVSLSFLWSPLLARWLVLKPQITNPKLQTIPKSQYLNVRPKRFCFWF